MSLLVCLQFAFTQNLGWRHDTLLQHGKWSHMIGVVCLLSVSCQMQPLEGFQQRFTGRPSRHTPGIASVESGQRLLWSSQLAAHLVFQQTEDTQPHREQAEQACDSLLRRQVQWAHRQRASFQTSEVAFDQLFSAVGQHRLLQRQLLGGLVCDIDMPSQTGLSQGHGIGIDLDT